MITWSILTDLGLSRTQVGGFPVDPLTACNEAASILHAFVFPPNEPPTKKSFNLIPSVEIF
jgi:hypothetical protein